MRCKACNGEMEPQQWFPKGADGPVWETLCPSCKWAIRSVLYGGGEPELVGLTDWELETGVDFEDPLFTTE